jgi:hypothetical protein
VTSCIDADLLFVGVGVRGEKLEFKEGQAKAIVNDFGTISENNLACGRAKDKTNP